MPSVLVTYATTHGHTRRIASRIADRLQDAGLHVELRELRKRRPARVARDYDAVVVGASVHASRHQTEVVEWARSHAASLSMMPSALFSVSLTAADDSDEARAATKALVDELIEQTGWTPGVVAKVAGALQYREYDLPTRVLMRLIARYHHQPTDVSRDVDFTDWNAVDRYADAFAADVLARTSPATTAG
jgi:menaquinone-dependent protoporphyrinogen oxidase